MGSIGTLWEVDVSLGVIPWETGHGSSNQLDTQRTEDRNVPGQHRAYKCRGHTASCECRICLYICGRTTCTLDVSVPLKRLKRQRVHGHCFSRRLPLCPLPPPPGTRSDPDRDVGPQHQPSFGSSSQRPWWAPPAEIFNCSFTSWHES